MKRAVTKESIIRDLERVREETLQMVRDAKAWNDIHRDEVPFDVGYDLVTARLAQDCIEAVRTADGPIPDEPFDRLRSHYEEGRPEPDHDRPPGSERL